MPSFHIRHKTRYHYTQSVSLSYHLCHLFPRNTPHQTLDEAEIFISPVPTTQHQAHDFFGNDSLYFAVHESHRTLEVESSMRVTVQPTMSFDPSSTLPWNEARPFVLNTTSECKLEISQFTFPSPCIPILPEIAEYASASFPTGRPLLEGALDLTRRIHKDFIFDPTATTVSTPVLDVLRNRRGVCQDFAHLEVACLKALGLPARYVSGYLETDPPEGGQKLIGTDASHAWVSLYCPGHDWIDLDPTNNLIPGERHITLAWGRDYSDISPLRGVTFGGGDHTLEVSVNVEQLEETSAGKQQSD